MVGLRLMGQLQQRITLDPRVMAWKPVIRGTHIPVELIVRMVAQCTIRRYILASFTIELPMIGVDLKPTLAPLVQQIS